MLILPDLILIILLMIYLCLIIRKKARFRLKLLATWLGISLFVDTLLVISQKGADIFTYILTPVILSWLISYLIIKRDRRRLFAGYILNLSLVLTGLYIMFLGVNFVSPLPIILLLGMGVLGFLVLTFGIYALIVYLFLNARTVWKKESRTLGNMLTLLLAVTLVLLLLVQRFLIKGPSIITSIYSVIFILLIYYFFSFLTILTSTLLSNYIKPKYNQDYLIILGAGLLNGETVTPLLAGRIDVGLTFAAEQLKVTGKKALLIMSGGQGDDEKLPEAVAMKNYALSRGVPAADIITEENSKTTRQNLQFSKTIMTERSQGTPYNSAFVSNDYHIFRAGLMARQAGLKSEGIGSRTAKYFVPNAFIREYIAIILMYKKRHIIFSILLVLMVVGLMYINYKYGGKG